MNNCVMCLKPIETGDDVRTVSPTEFRLHPQTHTVPDGVSIYNMPVADACTYFHSEMEHIHETCIPVWCDKFNLPMPEPFELGDWERIKREAFTKLTGR